MHADVRAHRVGELSPLPGRWDGLSDEADGTNGPLCFLAHRDQHGDSALSSLCFGGMSAHHLAYAGHTTPHTDVAMGQLARMFWTDPEPHNSFGF